jgi:hypothetical protein
LRSHRSLVLFALALSASAARADYVSQTVNLDQSNTYPDGVVYGSVKIEAYDSGTGGGGLLAGQVRLTYTADIVAAYLGTTKTFGIQDVGFNTKLSLKDGQISGPGGWKLSSNATLDGFGKFSWDVSGNAKGGSRPNPVTVLISELGVDATVGNFLVGSTGSGKNPPSEGSVYFAMHVAGFEAQEGSHWVGGSTIVEEEPPPPTGSGEVAPTPEPSSIVLCGAGALCLALGRFTWRRRKES